MSLRTDGSLSLSEIYKEYYTTDPSTSIDIKTLYDLYQGIMTSDISLNHFYGYQVVQTGFFRFQDPSTGTYFSVNNSCTDSSNGAKAGFDALIDVSFGGYNSGLIDISISASFNYNVVGTGFGNTPTIGVFGIQCSSNGGSTYNYCSSVNCSSTGTYSGSISDNLSLKGFLPNNLKIRAHQDLTSMPTTSFSFTIQTLDLIITAVHANETLKTVRITPGKNTFGDGGSNAFDTVLNTALQRNYLNWSLGMS
jgi:hypothetical protein